jgi:hypothetical protein
MFQVGRNRSRFRRSAGGLNAQSALAAPLTCGRTGHSTERQGMGAPKECFEDWGNTRSCGKGGSSAKPRQKATYKWMRSVLLSNRRTQCALMLGTSRPACSLRFPSLIENLTMPWAMNFMTDDAALRDARAFAEYEARKRDLID